MGRLLFVNILVVLWSVTLLCVIFGGQRRLSRLWQARRRLYSFSWQWHRMARLARVVSIVGIFLSVLMIGFPSGVASALPAVTVLTADYLVPADVYPYHTFCTGTDCVLNLGYVYKAPTASVAQVSGAFDSSQTCYTISGWRLTGELYTTYSTGSTGIVGNLIECDGTATVIFNVGTIESVGTGWNSITPISVRGFAIGIGTIPTGAYDIYWGSFEVEVYDVTPTVTPTTTLTPTPTYPAPGGGFPWFCPSSTSVFGRDYDRAYLRACGCYYAAPTATRTPGPTDAHSVTRTPYFAIPTKTISPFQLTYDAVPTATPLPTHTPGPTATPTIPPHYSDGTPAIRTPLGPTATPGAYNCPALNSGAGSVPKLVAVDLGGLVPGPPECFTVIDGGLWDEIVVGVSELEGIVPTIQVCLQYYRLPRIAFTGFEIPYDAMLTLFVAVAIIWFMVRL